MLGRLAPAETHKSYTTLSQETLQKAISKFKSEFCDNPCSPLFVDSIDKIIAQLDPQLLLAIKAVFNKPAVSSHFFFVRKLWQIAGQLGLRQRRFLANTKLIIDSLKKLPFERQAYVESKYEQIRKKHDGLTLVNPKYVDFFHTIKNCLLFDNTKSEEFEVFPHRVWQLSEYSIAARKLTNASESDHTIKSQQWAQGLCDEFQAINMGSEFSTWQIQQLFETKSLRDYDVSSVVAKVRLLEHKSSLVLSTSHNEWKYTFYPLETHQVLCYLGLRNSSLEDTRSQSSNPYSNGNGNPFHQNQNGNG